MPPYQIVAIKMTFMITDSLAKLVSFYYYPPLRSYFAPRVSVFR